MADYPGGSRKIDRALSDMKEHLDWLRDHRAPAGDPYRNIDLAREVGVMECMDMLRDRYHARLIGDAQANAEAAKPAKARLIEDEPSC